MVLVLEQTEHQSWMETSETELSTCGIEWFIMVVLWQVKVVLFNK